MAKQTFTTGQVLTAAQMTNLQQTAMGGGSPVTKTASYVLVAADSGTVIQMNSASATTITVNTALFAAGDSVQIQNIGAGVCTITAGTATVTTSGSLALSQWEGGFLYFTSASAAIFFDYTQTGAVSPLTTKGDVWGYSTLDARIPVGANDTVLTADSTQALGLKWAAPATGSLTLLSTTTLSGTSTTISSINQNYTNLLVSVTGLTFDVTTIPRLKLNNYSGTKIAGVTSGTASAISDFDFGANNSLGGANTTYSVFINFYTQTTQIYNNVLLYGYNTSSGLIYAGAAGNGASAAAVTSIVFGTANGTSSYTAGTVKIYGVK
jgi:hypothetical protein